MIILSLNGIMEIHARLYGSTDTSTEHVVKHLFSPDAQICFGYAVKAQ